ncbi:MAG: carbon starvation CstA family protein [Armatimonadota bacterium]
MNILVLFVLAALIFLLASRIYGHLVARWLGEKPDRPTPAVELQDGCDYVPANPNVLFGHHFASIAGAGPIVGPTLALLYGYLPVWLWVIIGGVFIGAVHDFAALFVSLRERGRSMAEIARGVLGERGFALFIGFALVMIILVTSAFLSMTATSLTSMLPLPLLKLPTDQTLLKTVQDGEVVKGVIGGIASTSVIVITACAPLLGWLLYRRGMRAWLGYLLAIVIALIAISIGLKAPVQLKPEYWQIIIAVYVLFAAGIPVWIVLQPRDFINVQILYAGIVALVVGVVIGGLQGATFQQPMLPDSFNVKPLGPIWPILFITVACGAISGFHALVAGGTTAKQLAKEQHARGIGFNGMLLESLLAVTVLVCVGAFLSRDIFLSLIVPTPSNPILAFAFALGNMLHEALRLPIAYGTIFGILLVEGFAVTTLDSAVRLNRYLFEELWPILCKGRQPAFLMHPWTNALISVALMLLLSLTNGFTRLWPLFATGNQMLAAITLIAISAWLLSRKRQAWFTFLPAVFMVITTFASLIFYFFFYGSKLLAGLGQASANVDTFGMGLLVAVDVIMVILSVGVVLMAISAAQRLRAKPPEVPEEPTAVGV